MSTTETRSVGIEVLDERSKPGSNPQEPATTLAEQIQDAIDSGMPLETLQRRFHLSESELRDYCTDIVEADEAWDAAHEGLGESGY